MGTTGGRQRRQDGTTPAVSMGLRLPRYESLPTPQSCAVHLKVTVAELQPTQMCIGLAEVHSRQADFSLESGDERRRYLRGKPVPLVRGAGGALWMIDRHHRLRALVGIDPEARAFGYVVLDLPRHDRPAVLAELHRRGWLYLHDGRGRGPHPPTALPDRLGDLQDDPYRSLVWKLKREGHIEPQPLIPFHEFRWGAWLRSRPLPPFHSAELDPALPAARALVRSPAAAHLAGWRGA